MYICTLFETKHSKHDQKFILEGKNISLGWPEMCDAKIRSHAKKGWVPLYYIIS